MSQRRKMKDDAVKHSKKVFTFFQEGVERTYTVFTPPGMKRNKKYPVVFAFHGGGGTMEKFAKQTNWLGVPSQIILVFPQAISRCIFRDGKEDEGNYWLTKGKKKLLCDTTETLSDLIYLDSVMFQLKNNYPIDTSKIFASGFSNGCGLILHNILAERPDTFNAVAGVGSLPQDKYDSSLFNTTPLYLSIGQLDERLLKHGPTDEFSLNYEEIKEVVIFKNTISYLSSYSNFSKECNITNPSHSTRLVYGQHNPKATLFILEIMEGIPHRFPNGSKKDNGLDMARKHWNFFKYYKQLKSN